MKTEEEAAPEDAWGEGVRMATVLIALAALAVIMTVGVGVFVAGSVYHAMEWEPPSLEGLPELLLFSLRGWSYLSVFGIAYNLVVCYARSVRKYREWESGDTGSRYFVDEGVNREDRS